MSVGCVHCPAQLEFATQPPRSHEPFRGQWLSKLVGGRYTFARKPRSPPKLRRTPMDRRKFLVSSGIGGAGLLGGGAAAPGITRTSQVGVRIPSQNGG